MNIISVTDITKTYTERKLFEKASFYLQEREKVGVIGINGTGKSTLLKIAAGIEEPDEGQVSVQTISWRVICRKIRYLIRNCQRLIRCWRKVVRILSEEHQSKIKMQEIMQNMWNIGI